MYVGGSGICLLGFQSVTQRHQLVDFGDDAMLFSKGRNRHKETKKLVLLYTRHSHATTNNPQCSIEVQEIIDIEVASQP